VIKIEKDYIMDIIFAAQKYGYNSVYAVGEFIQTENKLQNVQYERFGNKTDEKISEENKKQAYNEIMSKMLKIYVANNR
jgi:hypothetical protein